MDHVPGRLEIVMPRPTGDARRRTARAVPWPAVAGLMRDRELRILWIAYLGMSIADCLTTARALSLGYRERNPLAASLYQHAGMASLCAFKAVVLALILIGVSALPRRLASVITAAFVLATVLTVLANLRVLAGG